MRALEPLNGSRWADWTAAAHAGFQDWLCHRPRARGVDLADVLAHLRERLPPDAIVTNGAGNFTVWVHRFYTFRRYRTQLSPCSGAMGYGVPAAVAAKVVHPERIVVCVAGDGDFLMSGHELAAAAQERAPIVVLLVNPDFVGLAEAYGAHAELVERTEDFADAFERALRAGRAAVLELRVDPELITPRATLSAIRAGTA